MDFQRGLILTAGPSITSSEIESVMDAVTGGWNSRHSEFIKKFQDEFAAYIGVKHAMATSSCTGALHLSMLALDIKPGDEVLVPEMTWVASGAAPTYVGATPVFVDVEEDTWCLSPDSLRRNITPRTKAIVAVHLYGAPSNMPEIMRIAAEHRLTVIEDAAPAIGAHWGGKKMGTFGRTAAFSFQGAKLMVTGEGGMFCTDDSELYRKAQYLNDYAVDANRSYHVERLGLKYRMSNLQAALGIAQLRRIEELLERKRTIFGWYRERLGDLPELKLNVEKPESRNAFWMSSIVLAADLKIDRDTFRQKLKLKMVDTRLFSIP